MEGSGESDGSRKGPAAGLARRCPGTLVVRLGVALALGMGLTTLGRRATAAGEGAARREVTVVVSREPRARDLGALLVDAREIVDEVLVAEEGEVAESGAVLLGVERRGPAARAGLEPADAIVELGGERVFAADDLWRILESRKLGSRLPVTFVRDGQLRTSRLEVTGRIPPALRPPPAQQLLSWDQPLPAASAPVNGW